MTRTFKLASRVYFSIFLFSFSSFSTASDFNLPFINVTCLGNAYADWATDTSDASIAYANPAGLVKITHQQFVFSGLGLSGNTKFTGATTATSTIPEPFTSHYAGSVSSGLGAYMPSFYYSIPLGKRIVFALGQTTPFALGTSYDKDSIARYAATRSQIVVIDFTPSVGIKLSDKLAIGLGFDANRLAFTLNNMVQTSQFTPDAESQNHVAGWGYGWHGGILYQMLPATRLGVSFNSMVMFHATGDSESYPNNKAFFADVYRTTNQKSYAALPARTQLSIHHDLNSRWAAMGTLFYTNWSTLDKITLKNVILPGGTTIPISIPLNYHNTFDYSAGISFKATEKWLLRTGFQILSTPSNNRNRALADPIGSATILGLGAHYQQNCSLGYELGYAHSFFRQEPVRLFTPVSSAVGHTNTQTSVYGVQVTWNIT